MLAAMAALPTAAQTFDESLAAYDRGDYATAHRGFRNLAEQGDANAQYALGVMFDTGEGVPQDYAEALKWYRRAAEQGNDDAQNSLGNMFDSGEGVPQDYAEAMRWYRRAAEQGNAKAQFNLGVMFHSGEGVPQDYAEAVRLYRLAAEQGNAVAQSILGLMFYIGEGVPQDHILAYTWLNLAASRIPATETVKRNLVVIARDIVAQSLTPETLARAQRMAREWRPGRGAELPPWAPSADDGTDTTRRVADVQRALARLGYDPGPADGVIGPKTRAAIRAFQAAAGLPIDGLLSAQMESAVRAR